MGIDYSACYADVMDWPEISRIVPQAADQFTAILAKYCGQESTEELLECLAKSLHEDLGGDPASRETPHVLEGALGGHHRAEDVPSIAREILAAFGALGEAFERATTVDGAGLELGLATHDSQNEGCRGDELDGVYYYIADGAWQLSPAGRKFHTKFTRKHFTAWG
jgi:hypothetical protein